MKATRHNQRIAADIASVRKPNPSINYRALREENARRAARATGKLRAVTTDLRWLDEATRSVPAYEVLA